VKLEGGQKVLLKMEFNATLGDLWQLGLNTQSPASNLIVFDASGLSVRYIKLELFESLNSTFA